MNVLLLCLLMCFSPNNLLDAHNKERKSRGISVLKVDSTLQQLAQKHAETMAKKQSLYHQSLSKINSQYSGENIAMGQKDINEVMNSWMNSSGHKANILNKNYTKFGFGKATSSSGVICWCVDFGN